MEQLSAISQQLDIPILKYEPLSGGDISNAYLLHTSHKRYFLKTNASPQASTMFQVEKKGLAEIASTKTIATPKVFLCGQAEQVAYLLMEYIEPKRPDQNDFEQLGRDLARLHSVSSNHFGWSRDNFIGSLPQSNQVHNNWNSFYVEERLLPQLQLAQQQSLLTQKEVPTKATILAKGASLFKNISSVLLHGDLWSGNFLIASNGTPYLIDPAVYYGHAEVDIAMTRLFGGFDSAFYQSYYDVHPLKEGAKQRQDWYQLYYLLVHLNLFGTSYYTAVSRILKTYF